MPAPLLDNKAYIEPIELASRDEIAALQLTRLQKTVQHAYDNVAHYRHALDGKGVAPTDIKSLADISQLPFTVKSDLRDHYPFGLFAVPQQQVVRVHASSGTTGKPTVVGYTQNDIDAWANVVKRSIVAAGGHPSNKAHVAYGYGLFTGGLGAHYGAEKLGCMVIPVSGGMTDRQVTLINDFKPEIIMVTPSYMLTIEEAFYRAGLDPRKSSLNIGIFGAEPWTPELRTHIENAFDMHCVDIYGLSEMTGPGVANECVETKDGLHIWEDYFYPEIINPETGEVLPDGEMGELVLTTLCKEAMPILRYRTRDLTRLLPGTARNMRRIEKITGRTDDLIILRGVNLYPTQIEELILQLPEFSTTYQLVRSKKNQLDHLTVRVETHTPCSDTFCEQLANRLTQRIKSTIGVTVAVEVLPKNSLPRSEGKAVRIIDQRNA